MSQDDEAARKSRAESLRKRIADLKNEQDETAGGEEKPQAEDSQTKNRSGGSPRDFIHKRMRELDEEEEKEKDK
jgi:hypothetical protein